MMPDRLISSKNPAKLAVISWAAIGASALALAIFATAIVPVARAVFANTPRDPLAVSEQAERVQAYHASYDTSRAQINGRSMFFIPPEPPPAPKPKPKSKPRKDPPPPPPPATYGGPKVIAVVFDQVWFANGKKIRVGESSDDLEVIANDAAPWTVKVRWKDVEFDVEIFKRTARKLLQDGESGS